MADFELTSKSYRGGALELIIVLPRPGRFEAVRDKLTWATIREARAQSKKAKVVLSLPRFSITGSPKVDETIRARGATDVYECTKADLSGISEKALEPGRRLSVGKTVHVARIDVDEEGTKAAAATVVRMDLLCAPAPEKLIMFTVDRPFLYFGYNSDPYGSQVAYYFT